MITFLTRQGCSLCESARQILELETAATGAEIVDVDIDQKATLRDEYGARVPVVLGPSGEVLAEGRIDRRALRRALRRLGG